VAALKKSGARLEYTKVDGKGHLFDLDPSGELAGMYEFIKSVI
jgi:hypothetical protein